MPSPVTQKRDRQADVIESESPAKSVKHTIESSATDSTRRYPVSTLKLCNICPWIVDKTLLDYAAAGRLYPLEMIRLLSYSTVSELGIAPDLWHSGPTSIDGFETSHQRRKLFASVFADKDTYLAAWQAYWALAIEVGHEPAECVSRAFVGRWAEIQEIALQSGWSVAVRLLHDVQDLCAAGNIGISSPAWMDVGRAFMARQRNARQE